MKKNKFKILLIVLGAFSLAGCETTGLFGSSNLVSGSPLVQELTAEDQNLAQLSIEQALNKRGRKAVSWRNRSTGNKGRTTPGPALIEGLSEDGFLFQAPTGLSVDAPLETALGSYRLVRNSNIRLAPSTEGARLQTLDKGTRLQAYGRDNKNNWYLVGRNDKIIGYVYGTLVRSVGSSEGVLLGGPTVRPKYCRSFSHRITMRDGRTDNVSQTACQRSSGSWALMAE